MTWVTWRQHRTEAVWALALTALLAFCIAFVADQLNAAACSQPGVSYCFANDAAGSFAQRVVRLDLFQYGLVVFPALAGAFIGAPLVAREFESGTYRLAWTQGVTRTRWLLAKIVLVLVPLLLAAALVGWLEVILLNAENGRANHWAFFDQQAPMTVASTFFAFGLGVALGAVIRQPIPAMAATLFAFVVARIAIAVLIRPDYVAPLAKRVQDPSLLNGSLIGPTDWPLDEPTWEDSTGHELSQRAIGITGGNVRSIRAHAYYLVQHYQPGNRFWTFQWIETGVLCALAIALLVFAVYWVRRRAA